MLKTSEKTKPEDIRSMDSVLAYIPDSIRKRANDDKKEKKDIEKIFDKGLKKKKDSKDSKKKSSK